MRLVCKVLLSEMPLALPHAHGFPSLRISCSFGQPDMDREEADWKSHDVFSPDHDSVSGLDFQDVNLKLKARMHERHKCRHACDHASKSRDEVKGVLRKAKLNPVFETPAAAVLLRVRAVLARQRMRLRSGRVAKLPRAYVVDLEGVGFSLRRAVVRLSA